jgi:2-dehydro-3-deoxygluconokinase
LSALAALGEGLVELGLRPGPEEVRLGFGGDAANVCVMAARLGTQASLVGRVGEDPLGERLLAFWTKNGVELAGVQRDAGAPTGLYVNDVDPEGEHRFSYWRAGSAGSRLEAADLNERWFNDLRALVVTGVTLAVSTTSAQAVQRAVELARKRGALVACVLNHRPALGGDLEQLADLARTSDVLIGSRDDAHAVFGTSDWAELHKLLGAGPSELVLTDGHRPAIVVVRSGGARQRVPTVVVKNAAGAGDALAGAYLSSRIRGRTPTSSLAWGVAAASLSVQRDGCAASYPTLAETASLLERLPAAEALEFASMNVG